MAAAWFLREVGGSANWASLTGNVGEINGSATVLDSVERDFVFLWQQNGSVDAALSLLWQLDANSITAVEASLGLSWNVIVEADTTVEADLVVFWQRDGTVDSSLSLVWDVMTEWTASDVDSGTWTPASAASGAWSEQQQSVGTWNG